MNDNSKNSYYTERIKRGEKPKTVWFTEEEIRKFTTHSKKMGSTLSKYIKKLLDLDFKGNLKLVDKNREEEISSKVERRLIFLERKIDLLNEMMVVRTEYQKNIQKFTQSVTVSEEEKENILDVFRNSKNILGILDIKTETGLDIDLIHKIILILASENKLKYHGREKKWSIID